MGRGEVREALRRCIDMLARRYLKTEENGEGEEEGLGEEGSEETPERLTLDVDATIIDDYRSGQGRRPTRLRRNGELSPDARIFVGWKPKSLLFARQVPPGQRFPADRHRGGDPPYAGAGNNVIVFFILFTFYNQ